MTLKVGDKVPAFRLPSDGGGEVSASRLKGTPYVLYFYPKDNTAGCTAEAVAFTKLSKSFQSLGVSVIGISKDSLASHDRFKSKHNLKLILASDGETETAQTFGVWIEKKLYGKTSMGFERATFLVDKGGIIRGIWRKVKVDGHAEAVLAAAKSL